MVRSYGYRLILLIFSQYVLSTLVVFVVYDRMILHGDSAKYDKEYTESQECQQDKYCLCCTAAEETCRKFIYVISGSIFIQTSYEKSRR